MRRPSPHRFASFRRDGLCYTRLRWTLELCASWNSTRSASDWPVTPPSRWVLNVPAPCCPPTTSAWSPNGRLRPARRGRLLEEKSDVHLGGVHDLRPLVEQALRGSPLLPVDLLDVRSTLQRAAHCTAP